MSSIPATHVIQVTNVAPAATIDQMKELFGYLGRIRDIKLYPSESYILEPQSRVCYVEYYEKWSVGVAQHLTNTVFIDRALIVLPIADDGIPSESTALALTNPSSALPGLVSSGPNALINEISGVDGSLVITTIDPKLTALGLPQYPPLPANLDPVKIEEIRRTVTVGNLNPAVTAENLLKFVNQIGEVKFLRMSGDGIQVTKYALVEFTDQSSIPKVLQYNGVAFESRPLIINHSTTAIVKPLPKSSETAQKEIDEAMKRVREAQSLIAAVVEPELPEKERRRSRRSRSRSRSRYRSSSRSRRRRSRSRSKRSRSRRRSPHSRRRSRTPPKHSKNKSRSKSRERKKDASPRHKKERSQSRDRKKDASPPRQKKDRSRSHSRDRRKEVSSPRRKKERSRSRSRERKKVSSPSHKKERSRSHSRDRYKRNRSKSRSPSKSSSKSKSRKSKRSKEKVEKSRERTPKLEKNDKKDKSDERRSGSHNPDDRRSGSHHPDDRRSGSHHPDDRRAGSHHPDDRRSESQQHKENNQSNELYGPSLPVPESSSSFLEDSKSREQKFNSDMSLSPSSINTASVETSQNANNDPTFKKDMFGKNLSVFNKIDHDNILDSTTNTSQRTLTSDNTGILLNEGNDFISNMYCNRKDNCETMDSFHSRNSNTDLYEEIKGFGASGHLSIISENETTQNEDISAKFISKEEPNNNSFNKNDNCDILSALASSSTQSFSENPLGNSVISTFGLPCNNGEKDSANNSREPSNSIKSSVRCDKQRTSRSHSRSPSVVKRKKNKRSRSRSLSKEYSYSRKCKSRSTSKIRSPSRSYRRSRSRSKGSSRKASSPSRYNKIRNRSRSRSRSSKRKSYSPRRQYDSRRRNLSPKHHSSSSRKRSLTPRRKSRTPRRRSPTPHQKSRSPKHRSRSRSYKSQSPQRSKSRKYVRSRRTASKSPKRQSSSPSSSNLRLEQRKVVKENNKDKEFKSNPNFLIDGANIDSKVTLNYDEEDYNLEKMMEQKGHDNLEHLPINVENNYNCDYNSADMDLGSD